MKTAAAFRKIVAALVMFTTSICWSYPSCFLPGATNLLPMGTKYNVAPNLAAAINNYPGVGQALLNGINVWNVPGYFTNGRMSGPGVVSTNDCPTGLTTSSLQLGFYAFFNSSCLSALSNNVTGMPSSADNMPLGFVDFNNYFPCMTCASRSISLNANVVWSLDPLPGQIDLQSVMAHETGHVFGIAHGEGEGRECELTGSPSSATCALDPNRETMANHIYRGETCVRTLNSHDVQNAITPPVEPFMP